MVIPSAGIIEAAQDRLYDVDLAILADQNKELREALPHASDSFISGYNLGLETARVMLQASVALATHGPKPETLL